MVPIFSTLYNSFLVRVYMSSCGASKLLVYIYLCFLYYFYYYLVLAWLTSLTAVLCVWLFSEAKILKIMDKSLGTLLHLWGFFFKFRHAQSLPPHHKQCCMHVSRFFFWISTSCRVGEGERQENFEKEALFYEVTQKSQEVMKTLLPYPKIFCPGPSCSKAG